MPIVEYDRTGEFVDDVFYHLTSRLFYDEPTRPWNEIDPAT